jgi:membrane protease YdiL (CAAX protease family)
LQLRWPPARAVLTAVLLAVALAAPLVEVVGHFLRAAPSWGQALSDNDPMAEAILGYLRGEGDLATWWQYPLVVAGLGAVCEEVAFRGFILSGLRRRFRPWTAILLSSFLFALSHLNVFMFVPMFLLGVILGLLATRSGSIVPGVVFHVVHSGLVLLLLMLHNYTGDWTDWLPPLVRSGIVVLCASVAILYLLISGYRLWAYGASYQEEAPLKS